jgi:dipeptidyl aminopeptidase/acylaminoacyl peptidase
LNAPLAKEAGRRISPEGGIMSVRSASKLLAAATIVAVAGESARAAEVPLIPRKVFFGNPDKAGAQISPDGTKISYIAPQDGVMNVFVAPASDPSAAKVVTQDKKRGIRQYFWAPTSNHILYMQDDGGDENFHVYRVDLKSGDIKDLTPIKGVKAEIEVVSRKIPNEILVGLNDRFPYQLHDLYRINIETGERKLVFKNTGYLGVMADDDFKPRLAMKFGGDAGMEVVKFDDKNEAKPFEKIPPEDVMTTRPIAFDKTGKTAYIADSRGRNTSALFSYDLDTLEKKMIAEDARADLGGVIAHPREKTIGAVSFAYDRTRWKFLDPAIEADFNVLAKTCPGDVTVTSQTEDDSKWIVSFLLDNGPVKTYMYDRKSKEATFLFTNRKELEGLTLARMQPRIIKSRDGLDLVSYLTLPVESESANEAPRARPSKPLPMVLLVHGGPWARDNWGFNPLHQLMANRGYAVLSVNFRGSTGFGKNFTNAGNKEWARKMHSDLLDAVDWAVEQKIADPKKVAIMGGSYGGYATLVGLTMTPDVFACGVDIVGPSNIVTLLDNTPSYWAPMKKMLTSRVGDPANPEEKKMLEERSPLNHTANIKKPLLIGQGANDPRVKQAESDQIVKAMQAKNIPVTYVLFPDEGHGFQRPENSQSFFAVTDLFLGQHLGGRSEPISADTFQGSTIQVPQGKDLVPSLGPAVPAPAAKAEGK